MNYINELLNLDNKKIILASQSPRRIEMLHSVGLKFEIYPAKIVEKPSSYTDNFDYVRHNAILKGEWVWERTAAD
nr:Maf-like protein [candidate division KSB1 bacterium]NIT72392.1 Maf-like protein [candidate division KSB1 bacterium]NIV07207.1 hypothetical protein [candidate division Zixibacteria bacterium]NIX72072.1 hypothetical protein [candidate division KSB1 bacterium]